jgi:phage terminase small subunit
MNARHKIFVEEWFVNGNHGALAAIKAGYSKRRAEATASDLLRRKDIKAHIKSKQGTISKKYDIKQERLLRELAAIAFSDIRKYYDENGRLKNIKDLDKDAAAALAGVETEELFEFIDGDKSRIGDVKKIKRWDKVKAIETINKMLGYNAPEKKEVTGPNGTPLMANTIDYSKLSTEVLMALIDASRK